MCSTTYTSHQLVNIEQRNIKTTSHYKMTCPCCRQTIHRGDAITQIMGNHGQLRPRGQQHSVRGASERSYKPTRNNWVHLDCRPSYWYTYGWEPMFVAGFTRYSDSIATRLSIAAMDPDWGENYWEIPRPVWKFASERIEKSDVTTFQALWRGYRTRRNCKHSSH